MQQTWYVDFAGDIFFDENFRPRSVKTFIIQRFIRNFHTFLRISWVYLYTSTYSKGDSPVAHHGITLKRYLTWNPDVFPGQSLQKTSPPSLYFKMILHPASVFLRNYFFLLTASGQKLFRKKTLQTAHGRFKISQIRRLTFHLTSLIFRPRCNLGRQFSVLSHYPRRFCLSHVNNY